jgi:hypothetical protein
MSDVAIVSTSVYERPHAYEMWAKQGDLIVAGDESSPPTLRGYVTDIGGRYLTPDEQKHWRFSEVLGWRCIQRRNVAVMTAFADGYEHVLTVDDDNVPSELFVNEHRQMLGEWSGPSVVSSQTGWLNIGDFLEPRTNQRGHPLGASSPEDHVWTMFDTTREVIVSQAHVIGDPDCDAVTRVVNMPCITATQTSVIVDPVSWTPFNSQATMWARAWSPFIACLPRVGRYDDIFAGLIAQRVMRAHRVLMHVGDPWVEQIRNLHDPRDDLRNEYWGMTHIRQLCERLEQVTDDQIIELPLWHAYRLCANYLVGLLPMKTVQFMHEWGLDWEVLEEAS